MASVPDDPELPLPWPLPERTDLRDRLLAAWSRDRGYHDLRHLSEVLARIGELGRADDVELVLAAWFHDAVYDTLGDNEERSARLAVAALTEPEPVPGVDAAEVGRLVRLTSTHEPEPGDERGAVLCDADLAILAAEPQRYAEYTDGVRRDYATVPEADFRAGRLAVLEELAGRDRLFHTEHARARWEPRARANLAREIGLLSGSGPVASDGADPPR